MIKKLTGLFLCLLLLTGCAPKAQEDLLAKSEAVFSPPSAPSEVQQNTQDASLPALFEEDSHLAFQTLPLPQPLHNLTALCTLENTIYCAGLGRNGAALARTTADGQGGELALPAQVEFVYALCPYQDGFALLGGSLPAAYVDANGNTVIRDETAEELWLFCFDQDGVQKSSADLSFRYDSKYKFRQMLALDDGFILLSQNLLVKISPDGQELRRLEAEEAAPDFSDYGAGEPAFSGMALTEDGLNVLVQSVPAGWDARLLLIDPVSLSAGRSLRLQWRITGFGRSEEGMLLACSEKKSGSELDGVVMDACRFDWGLIWQDPGVTLGGQILSFEDGFLFFESYDTILKLLQKAPGPAPEPTVLQLAYLGHGSAYVPQLVREYNLMQSDIRIEMTFYNERRMEDELPLDELRTQIMAGNAPDLYCFCYYQTAGSGYLPDVAPESICVDLLPYLDADSTYNRSAFLPTLFDAVCKGDSLCLLPMTMVVETCNAPSDLIPEPGISFAELEEIRKAYPDILPFEIWQTPENILSNFLPFYAEKYAASPEGFRNFGSQEFADFLTLCKTWAGDGSIPAANEPSILRFSQVGSTEVVANETGEPHTLFGSERTYAGLPVENGYGHHFCIDSAVGISSQSTHAGEAWKFLRFCLSRQANCLDRLPVLSSAIDSQFDYYRSGTATNYLGHVIYANEEEIAKLRALLDQTTLAVFGESAAMQIVQEEAAAYFAGACTAEQAASAIASRAALFEMEQHS